MGGMRRRLIALGAVGIAGLTPPPARAAVPVLVIEGRGFGHGVGMSQEGALSMGRAGASTNQILGQFYPGTAIGRKAGYVRVPVLVAPNRAGVVTFPNGGEIRDTLGNDQSPGFPIGVAPGGRARIWFDGAYHVEVDGASRRTQATSTSGQRIAPPLLGPTEDPATTTTSIPPLVTTPTMPPTTAPGSGSTTTTTPPERGGSGEGSDGSGDAGGTPSQPPAAAARGDSPRPLLAVPVSNGVIGIEARPRRYRGFVEANAGQGPLRFVNQVDVEQYLRGMGEVRDPSWPLAALQAQAIAARTYALRAMASVGELCDDQRCQVYLGQQAEYPQMDRAVRNVQGQVLVYRGALASAVYSANGGGFEATAEEGFGPGAAGHPYLRAAPYLSKDPHPWTVRVGLGDVAARVGYGGTISAVRVARTGPSGRALKVAIDGTAGTTELDGVRFDARLGLKSTLFSLRVEQAATSPAPPPPPNDALVQALPDQAPPPLPTPAPDVPLDQLGIQLRAPTTTNGRPATAQAAVGARAVSGGRLPWSGLALSVLALASAVVGFLVRGHHKPPAARAQER